MGGAGLVSTAVVTEAGGVVPSVAKLAPLVLERSWRYPDAVAPLEFVHDNCTVFVPVQAQDTPVAADRVALITVLSALALEELNAASVVGMISTAASMQTMTASRRRPETTAVVSTLHLLS